MPATRSARPASRNARSSSSLTKQDLDPGSGGPVLRGYLKSLSDALIVIEAAMRGLVGRLVAKPSEVEKERYARSGNIIVFEESEVGIRRWTDPLTWSETRACPPYFIYRQTTSDNQSVPSGRSPKVENRGQVRSRGGPLDPQRLVGGMPDGKRCRNHGHVMEHGMCKLTMTINLPDKKWHIISYYYPKDIVSGKLKRPSAMTPLGDLIHNISEELLDPRLYYRKGRNCLLLTSRAEDGRLVYAGETDPSKRAEQPSTSESEKNEVHESASSSAVPLPPQNAPHATIFYHPYSSWTGMYPQAPPFSSDTLTCAPVVQQSLPQVYFSAVHSQPASPSSCSVTTTLASFSGQGWERDDTVLFQADLTSKPWAHQHTPHLPSQSSPFASPPMMDAPESSLATSTTAWPSPSNSNVLWGDSPSFGSTQFDPSSSQTSYQLQSIGGFDAASTAFGQLVPPANDEHRAIAGMNQAMQQTDLWWNGSGSLEYGDFWNQTIRN